MHEITRQKLSHRLGRPDDPGSWQEQHAQLEQLKEVVALHRQQGRHVIQVDECLFSGHRHQGSRHWAPIGRPLLANARIFKGHSIAVVGAVSAEHGMLHFGYKDATAHGGITAEDFKEFLHQLWVRHRDKGEMVVFLDNLRSHHAKLVDDEVSGPFPRLPIQLVFNIPYRPDLNGIEGVWAVAKRDYRERLDHFKARGFEWDQLAVVQDCIQAISDRVAKRQARAGWKKLRKAVPVKPADYDRAPEQYPDWPEPP